MPAAANERAKEDRAIAHLTEPRRAAPGPLQFSLETLLLVTTLVAACLGLAVAVPPLGTPLVVVVVLALVRTCIECRRMQCDGRAVQFSDKLSSFVGSFGCSFLAVVGFVLSFFFLGAVAAVLITLTYEVAETVGGRGVAQLLLAILSLAAAMACLGVSGMIFFSLYWTTMEPRLTLAEPSQPSASAPPNSA